MSTLLSRGPRSPRFRDPTVSFLGCSLSAAGLVVRLLNSGQSVLRGFPFLLGEAVRLSNSERRRGLSASKVDLSPASTFPLR